MVRRNLSGGGQNHFFLAFHIGLRETPRGFPYIKRALVSVNSLIIKDNYST